MIPLKQIHVLPISPEEGLKIIATVGLIQKDKIVSPGSAAQGKLLPALGRAGKSGPQKAKARARGRR